MLCLRFRSHRCFLLLLTSLNDQEQYKTLGAVLYKNDAVLQINSQL